MATKQQTAPIITLTLVVEYEDTEAMDVLEGVRELIENARGYGRPIKATLSGIPAVMEVAV